MKHYIALSVIVLMTAFSLLFVDTNRASAGILIPNIRVRSYAYYGGRTRSSTSAAARSMPSLRSRGAWTVDSYMSIKANHKKRLMAQHQKEQQLAKRQLYELRRERSRLISEQRRCANKMNKRSALEGREMAATGEVAPTQYRGGIHIDKEELLYGKRSAEPQDNLEATDNKVNMTDDQLAKGEKPQKASLWKRVKHFFLGS